MTLTIYALKDVKSGFQTPFTGENNLSVVRSLKNEIINGVKRNINQPLFTNPEDFQLFKLGVYNTDTGEISDNHADFVLNVGDIVSVDEINKQ